MFIARRESSVPLVALGGVRCGCSPVVLLSKRHSRSQEPEPDQCTRKHVFLLLSLALFLVPLSFSLLLCLSFFTVNARSTHHPRNDASSIIVTAEEKRENGRQLVSECCLPVRNHDERFAARFPVEDIFVPEVEIYVDRDGEVRTVNARYGIATLDQDTRIQ